MAKIGYARVSSPSQRDALEIQLSALREAGCERIFSEIVSGARSDRAEFVRMLDYVRPGLDSIIVWRLDRFSRGGMKELFSTLDALAEKKIAFHSLTENLESGTVNGRMMLGILAALNTYERELILERCNAGRLRPGAGRSGPKPTLTPEKLEAARALVLTGVPRTAAARALGVSRSALYRAIPVSE